MRSGFPRIDTLTVIPWLRYVDSLVTLGVWDRIMRRLAVAGHSDSLTTCDALLKDLRRLERDEMAAVLRGDHYHTLWSVED